MGKGLFGGLFDFNGDGKLDAMEQAMEVGFFESLGGRIAGEELEEGWDTEDGDEDEDELKDELEMAGLDRADLEFMDEDERREALEDAGLDPDDWEF